MPEPPNSRHPRQHCSSGTAASAAELGWTNGEGRVDVTVPVNERTEGDTRGNALTQVSMTVDPDQVCADLTSVRAYSQGRAVGPERSAA